MVGPGGGDRAVDLGVVEVHDKAHVVVGGGVVDIALHHHVRHVQVAGSGGLAGGLLVQVLFIGQVGQGVRGVARAAGVIVGVELDVEDIRAVAGQGDVHIVQGGAGGVAAGELGDGEHILDIEAGVGDIQGAVARGAAAGVAHEADAAGPAVAALGHGDGAGGDDAQVVRGVPGGAVGVVVHARVGIGDVAGGLAEAADLHGPFGAVHLIEEIGLRLVERELAHDGDHGVRDEGVRAGAAGVGGEDSPAVREDEGVLKDVLTRTAGEGGADVALDAQAEGALLHHRGGVVVGGVVGHGVLIVAGDDDGVPDGGHGIAGGEETGAQHALGGDEAAVDLHIGIAEDHDARAPAVEVVAACAREEQVRVVDGVVGVVDVEAGEIVALGIDHKAVGGGVGHVAGDLGSLGGPAGVIPAVGDIGRGGVIEGSKAGLRLVGAEGSALVGVGVALFHEGDDHIAREGLVHGVVEVVLLAVHGEDRSIDGVVHDDIAGVGDDLRDPGEQGGVDKALIGEFGGVFDAPDGDGISSPVGGVHLGKAPRAGAAAGLAGRKGAEGQDHTQDQKR